MIGSLLFSILIIVSIPTHASETDGECGFAIGKYKASHISDRKVPLTVEPAQFRPETFKFFKTAQAKAKFKYQKSIKYGPKKCPNAYMKVKSVIYKLMAGSNLASKHELVNSLNIIVLCSKTDMPPIARMVAGQYMLVPISLVVKSKSEAAMAAVLAHEMAHYTLLHHARLYEQLQFVPFGNPRSREAEIRRLKSRHEREADLVGLQLLVSAGYDPLSSLRHLAQVEESIKSENFSQPSSRNRVHQKYQERVSMLNRQIDQCGYSVALNQ